MAEPEFVVVSLEDVNQIDLDGLDSIKNIFKHRKKRRMAIVEPTKPDTLDNEAGEDLAA